MSTDRELLEAAARSLPRSADVADVRSLVEQLRLIAAWDTPGGPTPSVKPNKMATCNEAADKLIYLTMEIERVRAAAAQEKKHEDQVKGEKG